MYMSIYITLKTPLHTHNNKYQYVQVIRLIKIFSPHVGYASYTM